MGLKASAWVIVSMNGKGLLYDGRVFSGNFDEATEWHRTLGGRGRLKGKDAWERSQESTAKPKRTKRYMSIYALHPEMRDMFAGFTHLDLQSNQGVNIPADDPRLNE